MANIHDRLMFVAAAFATMLLGLWVHRGGLALPPAPRDVAGDALWATMIAWGTSAILPTWSAHWRAGIAFLGCSSVEVSQLVHTPLLDAWRATTLGQLVLGSGFDVRDLAAYAVGIALAVVIERIWRWSIRARYA